MMITHDFYLLATLLLLSCIYEFPKHMFVLFLEYPGIMNLLTCQLCMQFHECPARAIKNIVKESCRLLRPGGTLALTDNSVSSKIHEIQTCPLLLH